MRIFGGLSAFLALLACFSFFAIKSDNLRNIDIFSNHAVIIADDVWAFNQTSASSYLHLAMHRDHYRRLEIREPHGELFLELENLELAGIDAVLSKLHLIGVKEMTAEIEYDGRAIGKLSGERYVRIIYPLINSVIVLLFLVLAGAFVVRLFQNRKWLEQQVQEGTRNLQESERRFEDLVNLLPEMVWETDRNGEVQYANQMAHQHLGLGQSEGKKHSEIRWFSVIAPEKRKEARAYFHEVIHGGSLGLREFAALGTNGRTFPLLVTSAPIVKEGGVVGARCIGIDITERHELEEQLRRARSMKAIGLMAGGVAHDLNNILSGIVTYPELILMDLPRESTLRPALETIRRSGLAASEVVSDLLTVARGVAAVKESRQVSDLVQDYLDSPECRQLQTLYPEIELRFQPGADLPAITCSAVHVRKSLMNLVTNAAEAIPGKGEIVISTAMRQVEGEEAEAASVEEGSYVGVKVTDSGPGIPDAELAHIFEPFYTKKVMGRSGTGLGLAVVWNTLLEHGGTVMVTSGEGGTEFELLFPVTAEAVAAKEATVDWREYRGRGERILVVDDEPQQREIAGSLLGLLNYSVDAVESGEQALEYLAGQGADLLVLDMLMVPGMNGRTTYEKVVEKFPRQKAVLVSGFSESEDVRATLAMGAGAFVSKPYSIVQLGQAVYGELYRAAGPRP